MVEDGLKLRWLKIAGDCWKWLKVTADDSRRLETAPDSCTMYIDVVGHDMVGDFW